VVIGQCQGHSHGCGRFYCVAHNVDRLCADCWADVRVDQEARTRYREYWSASAGLMSASQSKRSWRNAGVAAAVAVSVVLVAVSAGLRPRQVPATAVTLASLGLVILGVVAAGMWWRTRREEQDVRLRYGHEPGFSQFAVMWQRQTEHDAGSQERLVGVIVSALTAPRPKAGDPQSR